MTLPVSHRRGHEKAGTFQNCMELIMAEAAHLRGRITVQEVRTNAGGEQGRPDGRN